MTTRIATLTDAPVLVPLINAAYIAEAFFVHGERTSDDEVRQCISNGPGEFLVLVDTTSHSDADTVVGTVYVTLRDGAGHFGMLAVDPARQGRGYGHALLDAVDEYCAAHGCRAIELEVFDLRTELHAFYASHGYQPVGTRVFEPATLLKAPAHLIVMRKTLDASPSAHD
jgi:ribosomal protein S18 acetylase RimI-like enzyme